MKQKRIAIAIVTLICFVFVTIFDTISLAWMTDNGLSSPIDITSNVHKSYFASGDGTKEIVRDEKGEIVKGPFEIATPLQLYYFAWLQYLGLFNEVKDGKIDTMYFRLSDNLDMTGYILPPIGTTNNPFLGSFDGENHTISNLTVENKYEDLFEAPEGTNASNFAGAEIIGFFGVIGELAEGSYNYDTQANEVKNVLLNNITVKTQTENALIGFVAGYVNGVVDRVGVIGSKVDIKAGTKALSYTGNISDYSLIGYCMPAYKNEVYLLNSSLINPFTVDKGTFVPDNTSGGESQGWGGSVKMSDIHSWLQNSMGQTSRSYTYTYERTDVVGLNGTRTTTNRSSESRTSYSVDGFGAFIGSNMNWAGGINFVGGGQKVTQFAYEESTEDVTVYYIKDGNYYLNFDGETISSTTTQANATKWYASNGTNGGALSTVVDGSLYYLTITDGNISVLQDVKADINNLPQWDFSGNNCSLNGNPIQCLDGAWQVATTNKYKIAYNGNYLHYNGTNVAGTTNQTTAATWTLEEVNNGYRISTVIGNTTYYLGYTVTTSSNGWGQTTYTYNASLSTSATTWQYSATNRTISINADNRTRYLRYSNGWSLSTNTYNLTFTGVYDGTFGTDISSGGTGKKIVLKETAYIDNSITNDYYDENGQKQSTGAAGISYFPLSKTANAWSVDSTNTGYIVGAEWGALEKGEGHDSSDANIRISAYDADSINNPSTPYTMTYKTGGKFKTISNRDATTLSNLGLQKYTEKLYKDYTDSIKSYCYGLHFMEASVSISNKAKITAKLKGETFENYEVPTNCIDFNLYDRGFINFVAGSYYNQSGSVNNSFFSIYEIVRDPNDNKKINEIKEIYKIYAALDSKGEIDTGKAYYYTYLVDGNEVGTSNIPTGYQMVFDCRWITHPDTSSYYGADGGPSAWELSKAFYFEVPVNKGEYAIGSTKGRTGAYLVYLDLAANAQLIERVKQYEKITENQAEATIPNGVELLPSDGTLQAINPSNSAFVTINTSASGEITFNKNGNEITHSAKNGTTAEYVGVDTVLKDGNGNPMSVPITKTTTIERMTYWDRSRNTGELTVTVITKTTVTINGVAGNPVYTMTTVITDAEGNKIGGETIGPQETELRPEMVDKSDTTPNAQPDGVDVSSLIDIMFAYGKSVNVTLTYEYDPDSKTYTITIENPGADAVDLKAVLTQKGIDSGITFIITDGTNSTTLTATQDAQKVTIAGKTQVQDPPSA